MKFKKSIIGTVAVLAMLVPVGFTAVNAASQDSTPGPQDQEFEARMEQANQTLQQSLIRLGVINEDGTWAEDTRETRVAHYQAMSEAFPEWVSFPPQPAFAPPDDWQPDADQVEYQDQWTEALSDELTANGIEHAIELHVSGVNYVDFDQFDPQIADAVSAVIAKREFMANLPGSLD